MRYLLFFAVFVCHLMHAQESFNPEKGENELYKSASFTTVENQDLDINSIIKNDSLKYQSLSSDNHSVGFTSSDYWVKFKLENTTKNEKTYYLETARPITDVATLYQINKAGDISAFKSGDQISFNERQVQHRSTFFKLTLPSRSTQQFYIHLKSDGETINIPLNLYSESTFWMVNYKQQLFLGIFYGLLFLAGTIYLFFYTGIKEKTFLYYGFYVFSIGLMQAALDGFIHQYILPEGGFFNSRAVLITALLSNFFLLKYCEHFLKVREVFNKTHKVFNTIYIVLGILFLMLFINPKTLELAYPLSNLNGLFSLVLIVGTLFRMRYKRIKIDTYFTFGIFFLVIGLLGFVMNNLSLLPNNFYTLNSAKFGSGFEVIFLSMSMTTLIRNLRVEKEISQREALQKAEEVSLLKTYFMSNMSHELRTPINAIMGIAETELKELKDEDRKPFEIIKNASFSLLSNINDILDFENIEKNKLKLDESIFNPTEAIQQIVDNWKIKAEEKGIAYQFKIDNNLPESIKGDSKRFIQIINNVLGNAVKFTNKGSVRFKLSCIAQPNNIHRFSIHISDTGVGMDAKMKSSVYDSFNQMRLNHKREFGGVGLGLTIVRHLVALFKGSIKIESEKGVGTEVFIDLELESAPKALKKEILKQKVKQLHTPMHILVVEDNKLNQMVMGKLLKSFSDVTYTMVNNGQEALDALKTETFNVVLMDLQMPVMDGYEATEIIRSGIFNEAITKIPIIAVTADAMQETKQRVLDLGMNDYLTKPVNKDVLLAKIASSCHTAVLKIA
ncbi:7TM diverse intracellular signaling domain-containing protein [Oceanihabitans sp. 2_MG-2023]|uniref:hybrid sensor histidine kinase/response regulator n=1 Tax=Oceanihabitans sp. 2_MG-2023 TaxID=3062661 RepID=UPI0026E1F002|nr:hybrid sensor histidine kinase/response regulator [Oceanihabitans sp. 2_MG-2023]MDO6595771.1 7TM diverse intracellular signaling domain-containing protein [Oceanihabitans sp. 2_MG-2023]